MGDRASREFILETAALLVQESGVDRLTFEVISQASDLDQSQIMEWFPALSDLVAAMTDRLAETFYRAVAEECGDDESIGSWLRAYVNAGFELDSNGDFSKIGRALLSSVAYRPYFLDSFRDKEREFRDLLYGSGVHPETAIIVRAAMEGFFLSRMFGNELLPEDRAEAVRERLLELTLEMAN